MSAFLRWGVKASFREYVQSLSDGSVSAQDGACIDVDGKIRFELSGETTTKSGRQFCYRGDLRFSAHGGIMFVMLLDPWVVIESDDAILSVVDLEHWPDRTQRLNLARLAFEPGEPFDDRADSFTAATALTATGTPVFGDIYPAGCPLDDVTFTTT